MKEIRCSEDLGIADCDLVAKGDTPAEIVGQVVEHLRQMHGMEMPDASAIMTGDVDETDVDREVWAVVKRLRDDLGIGDVEMEVEEPPGLEGPAPASPEPV